MIQLMTPTRIVIKLLTVGLGSLNMSSTIPISPIGWALLTPKDEHIMDDEMHGHLIPDQDLHQHELSEDCWCQPNEDYDITGDLTWSHHAADGREDYELGRRKPH